MRKKPGFPAHFRVSWEAWPNAEMAGWRRSADRACLQANSLLTGNFTGKFVILELSVSVRRVLESYESPVIQEWWPDSRRGHRCGRARTAPVTTVANCDIRAI